MSTDSAQIPIERPIPNVALVPHSASNCWHLEECLKRFVRRGECALKELVAKELGTPAAREAKNRIPDQDQQGIQTTAAIGQEALLHRIATEHKLNDSQSVWSDG